MEKNTYLQIDKSIACIQFSYGSVHSLVPMAQRSELLSNKNKIPG